MRAAAAQHMLDRHLRLWHRSLICCPFLVPKRTCKLRYCVELESDFTTKEMGKSAKITRGGNKQRVNVGRQEAKAKAYAAQKSAIQGKKPTTPAVVKDKAQKAIAHAVGGKVQGSSPASKKKATVSK
jgi:hypothetical protein